MWSRKTELSCAIFSEKSASTTPTRSTRSRHEKASTPVKRLLACGGLSEHSHEVLLGERSRLHFCELNRQIRESLRLALFAPHPTFSTLLNEAFTPKNYLPSVHFFVEASHGTTRSDGNAGGSGDFAENSTFFPRHGNVIAVSSA